MKNEFVLSPAFCLFNKVLVLVQSSEQIVFGLVQEDAALCERLCRSVKVFFGTSCPEIKFRSLELSEFTKQISKIFKSNNSQLISKNTEETLSEQSENAAAALLDSLLANACDMNATDIHIEGLCVRFRVCGVLKEYEQLEKILKNMNNLKKTLRFYLFVELRFFLI